MKYCYRPKAKYHLIRRKRKPSLAAKILLDIVLALILIIEAAYFVFFSPVFKIKEIKINSQNEFLKEKIWELTKKELETRIFYIFKKENFFLVGESKLCAKITENYPEIKKADFSKKFPGSLFLNIKERQAVGVVFRGEENFLIDEDGVLFKKISIEEKPEGLISLIFDQAKPEIGKSLIPLEKMQKILLLKKELADKIALEKTVLFLDKEKLTVRTNEGWEIYFDFSQDFQLAATKLNLLLEEEISGSKRNNLEYIDLRFSKVFIKYK